MAKPQKIEEYVRAWLDEQGDDGYVAHVRCKQVNVAMTAPGSSMQTLSASSADPRSAAALVGRDLADHSLVLGYTHAFIVTDSTFRVCRLTGFKERVKDLVVEAPFAATTLQYLDAEQSHGHTVRYLIVDLGDGRWVIDSLVYLDRKGSRTPFADASDSFVTAFGARATRVDVD